MSHNTVPHQAHHGSFASYTGGFVASILLTLIAYLMVFKHVNGYHLIFSHRLLIGSLAVLAIAQLLVQVVFFLHVGTEPKPKWNLYAFLFMVLIVLILVIGSLWIMYNLNYHMTTPDQMNTYMRNNDGI